MTQGDERMKAAKASIRQRLTHSKLPMLVLVGVVLFALIFLGMRFFTRYTREELYRESQNQLTEIILFPIKNAPNPLPTSNTDDCIF